MVTKRDDKQQEPRKVNLLDGNSLKTALDECAREFGPGKFPANWWSVAFCVLCYSALTMVINMYSQRKEGDAYLICKPRKVVMCHDIHFDFNPFNAQKVADMVPVPFLYPRVWPVTGFGSAAQHQRIKKEPISRIVLSLLIWCIDHTAPELKFPCEHASTSLSLEFMSIAQMLAARGSGSAPLILHGKI
eukprot:1148353-Pelagomonas_calceolata.AAC.2